MADTTKIQLVSSEISGIWNAYTGENILICILKYFHNRVDDDETSSILQYALDLSNQHINLLTNLFNQEKLPVPKGFTDEDVDINAPRLFTDTFYLQYIIYSARISIHNYSLFLTRTARSDVRDFFSKCIFESVDLYNKAAELSLSNGTFIRTPRVEVPKEVKYIKNESLISSLFKQKNPLLTDEITHIYSNFNDTIVRRALVIGFYQVCTDKKISDYMSKALTLSAQHNKGFTSLLTKEDIPIGGSSDSYVTDSTVSPFSNKFMLSKILIMYRVKIGSLGMALADVSRVDVNAVFMKYLNDSIRNAQFASIILTERGWLEQPPQAINYKNLAEVK